MQRVMQNNAAVFRTQETLEEGKLYQHIHYISTLFFISISILNDVCQSKTCKLSNCWWYSAGCALIDKVWESFHDVKIHDRSLIW